MGRRFASEPVSRLFGYMASAREEITAKIDCLAWDLVRDRICVRIWFEIRERNRIHDAVWLSYFGGALEFRRRLELIHG